MTFEKAYEQLLLGKRIRRKEWEPLMYIHIVDGTVKTFNGEHTNFYANADIITSNGWRIIDGDGSKISFIEALEALKQKKYVTNEAWDDLKDNSFIFVDNGQIAKCRSVEYAFMPTYKCFCANDWEIMK